jgi:hypothetical protein
MLIKISLLLLVALAVLGIFGRTRFPPAVGGRKTPRLSASARKCPKCDRHLIGKTPCPCTKGA